MQGKMAKPGLGKMGDQFRILFRLGFVCLLFVFLSDNTSLVKSPLYLSRQRSRSSYLWTFQQFGSNIGLKGSDNGEFSRKTVASAKNGSRISERKLSDKDHRFSRMLTENAMAQNSNYSLTPSGNLSEEHENSRSIAGNSSQTDLENEGISACAGLEQHRGYTTRCEFLEAHKQCTSGGLVEYITFFNCTCEKWPMFGYAALGLWLVALFYMLGNTAADYFCCSLEKLSKLLKLPPTVAGVTLLPLGNGAPDVFASIAAFVGADAGEVGLNSVLGGAVFVTTVVAGSVSLFVASSHARIDRQCFVRDVGFFLFTLASLCLILVLGKVNLWGATTFLSIYVVYAFTVAANEYLKNQGWKVKWNSITPMRALHGSTFSLGEDEDDSIYSPLFDVESSTGMAVNHGRLDTSLPQWMWASNVAIYSNYPVLKSVEENRPLWGWSEESEIKRSRHSFRQQLMCLVDLPLTLPRQLTIPLVEDDRWVKGVAVASVTLAPILLSLLWNTQESKPFGIGSMAYVVGGISGAVFGTIAYFTTTPDHPPRRYLFPWVAGGFIMSIVWFYIIANELVALLVSFGVIFEIDPSILGLTVLAWGNSMGDLMSNIALALNGGDGVQIAMSGCYAGPMFNTLAGLGISLFLGSWSAQPAAYIVPKDTSLFYTLGFLVTGLVWALIVLPLYDMRPSKLLGVGLLILYSSFLLLRLSNALGLFSISGLY